MYDTRRWAWGYVALFGVVVLTGYIPAFIDEKDMIFGLFRRTWYADGLHIASAIWAAVAALTSSRSATFFFRLFGPLYFLDGLLGFFTGSGYLDFGIFINGIRDLPFSVRFFANAPHLAIGGLAAIVGYVLAPRAAEKV